MVHVCDFIIHWHYSLNTSHDWLSSRTKFVNPPSQTKLSFPAVPRESEAPPALCPSVFLEGGVVKNLCETNTCRRSSSR
jgi:hypothetical protein